MNSRIAVRPHRAVRPSWLLLLALLGPPATAQADWPVSHRLVSALGDSVEITADTLMISTLGYGSLRDVTPGRTPDGILLPFGDQTPPGIYELANGRFIQVDSVGPKKRNIAPVGPPHPVLRYTVRSARRIGVWIRPDEGPAESRDEIAAAVLAGLWGPFPSPLGVESTPMAYELPRDWKRSAEVAWPRGATEKVRITWISFEDPAPEPAREPRDPPETRPTRKPRSATEERIVLGFSYLWFPPDSAAFFRSAQVIGTVVADPKTRRWSPVE